MQSISFNHFSAGAQMSIKAFYYDFSCQREQGQACLSYAECSREWRATHFCNFMVENYSATPDQLMLDWNYVGACIHYFGEDRTIQFRLRESSEGHLGIPNMTLIVINLRFKHDPNESTLKAFFLWLAQTARIYGFRHIANEDEKPTPDDPK